MSTTINEMAVMTLSHLGTGKSVSDLDNESSEEGNALRVFKDVILEKVASLAPWPEFTRIENASLVTERPNNEWAYSYRKPAGALNIRRIASGQRTDTRDTRVPFREVSDDAGLLIYTDMPNAIFEYTKFINDPSRYSAAYVLACSHLWAYYIAPRLCKGNHEKIRREQLELFKWQVQDAAAHAFNGEQPDVTPDAEWLRAR